MTDIHAPYAGDALSPEERQLYDLITAYRAEHGLGAIPLSRALTTTAARHTLDLMENQGGYPKDQVPGQSLGLGWSDAHFDNNDPSTAGAVQNAPQRLGTGYSGPVQVMSTGYVGARTPDIAASEAMDDFKNSAGINAKLLNLGTWATHPWKAIGLSIHNGVAELWLGENSDLSGPPPGGPTDVPSPWLGGATAEIQAGFATADAMRGLEGNDTLFGLSGDDRLEGGEGDDSIDGGTGSDTIDGGAGTDLASFGGALGDYRLSRAGGWLLVEGPDGTDLLKDVEQLRFGLAAPVTVESLRASGTIVDLAFARTDTASGQAGQVAAAAYDGPVSRLAFQFVSDDRGEAVNGTALSDFLNTRGGDDAVNAGAGDDVLDGGLGSNFLTGGAGWDVFFSDGRGGGTTWSTITDWQAGEQLSLWGWRPGVSRLSWAENEGAEGFRGATLHADLDGDGAVDTSVTWSGLAQAALNKPYEMDGLLWFQ